TVYGYDGHGRRNTVTDARTGPTSYSFGNDDQTTGMTTPAGSSGAQVTTNYFDLMGRNWKTGLPDNTSLTNLFYPTGEPKQVSGSRTYPTGYRRDAQGRQTGMTNWTAFPMAGERVTGWTNDTYRGFTINK